MISMLQPLIAGNAIRVFIEPISGAKYWRVLKKASDTFSGHDDQSAVLVYEGDEKVVVDASVAATPNGTMLFYRAYYWNGTAWVSSVSRSATPAATYEEHTTDTMSIVRERLEAFLLVEVERGNFLTDLGYIQVYTAPPSLDQNIRFPVVTITLENESPAERGIGENISGDEFDYPGMSWFDSEGWLAEVQLQITGWSLNSDERIELRKALRRFVAANLQVFDAYGMTMVNMSQSDVDAVNGEYGGTNIYQTIGNFSCLAPVRVGSNVNTTVADVISRSINNG